MSIKSNQTESVEQSPLTRLENHAEFIHRHIGPDETQISHMLETLGIESLEKLIEDTLPPSIQLDEPLSLPTAKSE